MKQLIFIVAIMLSGMVAQPVWAQDKKLPPWMPVPWIWPTIHPYILTW